MTPKLLSPEDLAEEKFPLTLEEWRRVLAHIAALEADNAARLSAFCNYVDMHGVEHDLGCPEDDTCECPLIVALKAAFRDDSPGATLLSEHAKALERAEVAEHAHAVTAASLAVARVRARNEGLERAAQYMEAGWTSGDDAAGIRAMKETEE